MGCLPDELADRIDRIERTVNPDALLEIRAHYSLKAKERAAREAAAGRRA